MIGTAGDFTMGDDGHWSGPDPQVVRSLELAFPGTGDDWQPWWLPDRPRPLQALVACGRERGWPVVISRPLEPLPEGAVG